MMVTFWLFGLVFCCFTIAGKTETVLSHDIVKRSNEEATELELENELRRVKRTDPLDNLPRSKRQKRHDELEQELSRIKRHKRSVSESSLSRVKRKDVEFDGRLAELSRVKRFIDSDLGTLSRTERHKRSRYKNIHPFYEPELTRAKRTKRSPSPIELEEIQHSRSKRFYDPNYVELLRAKRLKRSLREKRIPDDLHKKFRNRNLENMTKSKRKHFKSLKGYGAGNLATNRHINHNRDTETFKRRVQDRLHSKHHRRMDRKRMNHKKMDRMKDKKNKHHVQSYRLNKKRAS